MRERLSRQCGRGHGDASVLAGPERLHSHVRKIKTVSQTKQERNKALVHEAFDTLFNRRDYKAASLQQRAVTGRVNEGETSSPHWKERRDESEHRQRTLWAVGVDYRRLVWNRERVRETNRGRGN